LVVDCFATIYLSSNSLWRWFVLMKIAEKNNSLKGEPFALIGTEESHLGG